MIEEVVFSLEMVQGALAIEATNEFDNFIGFDMRTDGGKGFFS